MTESERRAVRQVRVLWPYMGFVQRYGWVDEFRQHCDDDFVRTVELLSGFALGAHRDTRLPWMT